MNTSVSIYHKTTSDQIFEYPVDTINPIKSYLGNHSPDSNSSLITARKNNLMYYAYDLRLSDGDHFGIIIGMNGVYVTDLQHLKDLFEDIIHKTIEHGIIEFSIKGSTINELKKGNYNPQLDNIESNLKIDIAYTDEIPDVDIILNKVRDTIQSLSYQTLPPKDYSISPNNIEISDCKELGLIGDSQSEHNILNTSVNHSIQIINLSSFDKSIKKISNDVADSIDRANLVYVKKLKKEIVSLRKQFLKKTIGIIVGAIVVCTVIWIIKDGVTLATDFYDYKESKERLEKKTDSIQYISSINEQVHQRYKSRINKEISKLQDENAILTKETERYHQFLDTIKYKTGPIIYDVSIDREDERGPSDDRYFHKVRMTIKYFSNVELSPLVNSDITIKDDSCDRVNGRYRVINNEKIDTLNKEPGFYQVELFLWADFRYRHFYTIEISRSDGNIIGKSFYFHI